MNWHDATRPAFPVPEVRRGDGEVTQWPNEGQSLLDYFAAKAMAACISTAAGPILITHDGLAPHIAKVAYDIAEAMIEEGNRRVKNATERTAQSR